MRRRTGRIAHVVQAVEKGNEIEILVGIFLGGADLEPGVGGDAMLARMRAALARSNWGGNRNRRIASWGKPCAINTVDHAMAAADIGDLRAALQFVDDAIERRQPAADQIVVVARAKEASHRTEQAARLITPSDAVAGLERRLDLLLIVEQRGHHVKGAGHDRPGCPRSQTPSPAPAAR